MEHKALEFPLNHSVSLQVNRFTGIHKCMPTTRVYNMHNYYTNTHINKSTQTYLEFKKEGSKPGYHDT
jgi:hypothetical protein